MEITVTMCRDCCCGSSTKHPGVDHDLQRRDLQALASATVRVRTADCLDECQRSNVVHVRRHLAAGGRRDTWLGAVLSPSQTSTLVDWVAGGAGPLPETLRPFEFAHQPPGKNPS